MRKGDGMAEETSPEFRYPVRVSDIGAGDVTLSIHAGETELRALARRFGIDELCRLDATVRLGRLPDNQGFRVDGVLTARVVQTCVVTLKPVSSDLEEEFSIRFAPGGDPPGHGSADNGEVEITPEEADTEFFDGGVIEVGEAIAQQLALSLEPYPRLEDAAPPVSDLPDSGAPASQSAFAVLDKLKVKT